MTLAFDGILLGFRWAGLEALMEPGKHSNVKAMWP